MKSRERAARVAGRGVGTETATERMSREERQIGLHRKGNRQSGPGYKQKGEQRKEGGLLHVHVLGVPDSFY